jgi:penicillin-binding protein 1A
VGFNPSAGSPRMRTILGLITGLVKPVSDENDIAGRGQDPSDGAPNPGSLERDEVAKPRPAQDESLAEWRVGARPSRIETLRAEAGARAGAAWETTKRWAKVAQVELDKAAAIAAVLATQAWAWCAEQLQGARAKLLAALGLSEEVASRKAVRRGPEPTWKRAAIWGGWTAGAAVGSVMAFMVYVTWDMPSTDDLWSDTKSPSYTFLDVKGRVIWREGAQNAPPVDLKALPPHVGQAVLAIEDKRFYKHVGVDLEGLTRAAFSNVQSGRVVQGGSTITQQLAKNLFLTNERTFRRKAQEVALALWLEGRFSKDQILALYLSRVFFGAGAWGVEAASERYFDKPAGRLTLAESALLAGLLKAPSRMNPAIDPTEAKARSIVVLSEMVAEGFITPAQRDQAVAEKLIIKRRPPSGNFGYFREWIDADLQTIIGEDPDDFIIETTLDLDAQRAGERAVADAIRKDGEKLNVTQGALLSIDDDGGVRAMVGGSDFEATQFNRTTQARRQPGSAFKFYIYLAAMERGISPYAVRNDAPIVIGDWAPGNYDNEYFGPVPLTFAFAKSLNMVAIEVAQEVGGERVIDVAKRLGVRSDIRDYRSLALGAQEMTLGELTQSYATVSNGGFKVAPFGIRAVRRASGNVIYRWKAPENRERLIAERDVRGMNLLMSRVVEAGTGTRARLAGRASAGKTGTGNDYRDAWFIGYTSGLTTGVWIGNDDFRTTKKVTGGSLPATIWKEFMQVALRDMPPRPLMMPRDGDYIVESAPEPTTVSAEPSEEAPALVGAPLVVGPPPDDPSLETPEG